MPPETRVYRWRIATLENLARSLRYRLMNIEATGIYGDGHGFRSLWDEFCYEQQEGPTSELSWAWEESLLWPTQEIFGKIPAHVKELLSWSLFEEHDEYCSTDESDHFVDEDAVNQAIIRAAAHLAIDRDLSVLLDRAVRPWRRMTLKEQCSEIDLPLFQIRSEPQWNIEINRLDLIEALKIVRTRATLKRNGNEWERDVTLTGGDGLLSLRSSHAAYDAPVLGTWSSPIRTLGASFMKLVPKLTGDKVTISYANGVLTIGTTQYPAREV